MDSWQSYCPLVWDGEQSKFSLREVGKKRRDNDVGHGERGQLYHLDVMEDKNSFSEIECEVVYGTQIISASG